MKISYGNKSFSPFSAIQRALEELREYDPLLSPALKGRAKDDRGFLGMYKPSQLADKPWYTRFAPNNVVQNFLRGDSDRLSNKYDNPSGTFSKPKSKGNAPDKSWLNSRNIFAERGLMYDQRNGPQGNDIAGALGAIGGGGFNIPGPESPDYIDSAAQARSRADAYIKAQLDEINRAKSSSQGLHDTNSANIGKMYGDLSADIKDDSGFINSSYNSAIQSVDKSYGDARKSVSDTEAQSLARREALAQRLGTEEGINDLTKQVGDDTAAFTALLGANETATDDYLTSQNQSNQSFNTANAQNAILAGNSKKSDLTAQLTAILGQLDLQGTKARGQGEQMFGELFDGYENQNRQAKNAYQEALYRRQMDEVGLEQNLQDRAFAQTQYADSRSDRAEDMQMQMAQMRMEAQGEEEEGIAPSAYQNTVNAATASTGSSQKGRILTDAAYRTLSSPDAKRSLVSSNAGQFAAAIVRANPGLDRQFSRSQINDIASRIWQEEKLKTPDLQSMFLAQNQLG